ncbi:hypothetical protein SAMN05216586_105189 [Halopseudomonas aestusnigri]|uniref:Uncharacterized protein n=1 Tax=Halopseudomonas aestusnigri TaxID=857252 RepID=A0AAQ1JQC2_9GAMM|nr:hypothetical protein SAMN05216586_105189 [Halopseudomonas aestusnigri]
MVFKEQNHLPGVFPFFQKNTKHLISKAVMERPKKGSEPRHRSCTAKAIAVELTRSSFWRLGLLNEQQKLLPRAGAVDTQMR